jgi:CheY-like chemotaxis protein
MSDMEQKKFKVLIAEDEKIIALDIQRILLKAGYDVLPIVSKGEDAVLHSRTYLPDWVLMDIGLKGRMNGIEAGEMIKKELNIPIIYLSGSSEYALFENHRVKMNSSFLSKPFNEKALLAAINKVIS